jgi:hypothetical protein
MQTICRVVVTPEEYVQESYQRRIAPPAQCPNCLKAHCLEALGYYGRYLSARAVATVLRIWVRRFWCRRCCVSVSCLPDFAQPYRLVNSASVEAGFEGQADRPDVQRWAVLIAAYWRRFEEHLASLIGAVGPAFGPLPLKATAAEFWGQLKRACGGLATATRQLVNQFRTCLFGTYRCHQPKVYHAG